MVHKSDIVYDVLKVVLILSYVETSINTMLANTALHIFLLVISSERVLDLILSV